MIVGAAVCPGAPFLVEGVADALGFRHPDVRAACEQALSALPAADSVYVVSSAGRQSERSTAATTSGPAGRPSGPSRWLNPGVALRSAGIVRSDHPAVAPVELAPGGGPDADDFSTGTFVAAYLLTTAAITAPATAVEIDGDPDQVAVELAEHAGSVARVALLVIADGAACHGDEAPGRRDDRAATFDDLIVRALADGDPAALATACADSELNAALLACVDPLRVLAQVTDGRPPSHARVLYSGAPMGVGYVVSCWRWTTGDSA
ncbi:hypothetical protein ACVBEQ_17900 [Nakamurella sp. GG22]